MPITKASEIKVAPQDAASAPELAAVDEYLSRLDKAIGREVADGRRELAIPFGRGYPAPPDLAVLIWRACTDAGYEVAPHPQGGKIIRW